MSKNITWESIIYPDGATYQGLMRENSICHYRGVFSCKEGDRYAGEYRDNMMTGYGVYYWKDTDSTYYGQWKNNNMHGCGVKVYPDDVIEEGEWLEDAFVGDFMACSTDEAHKAAEEAKKMAARARLFENKPDGEVEPSVEFDHQPLVYQAGTEYLIPGPLGAEFEVPKAAAKEVIEGEKILNSLSDMYLEVLPDKPGDPIRRATDLAASVTLQARRWLDNAVEKVKVAAERQITYVKDDACSSTIGDNTTDGVSIPPRPTRKSAPGSRTPRPPAFASLSLSHVGSWRARDMAQRRRL